MGNERERIADTSAERMVVAMRETAARLNGIIQSAMDAIITVDENQDIVIFNPAAEQMFGCSAANVLGTPLDQFIPVRYRDAHHSHIRQFGATGVSTRRMGRQSEIIGLRANGEEFPVEASISQTVVSGKKLFSVILRDVMQRNRADQALKDSAERYQRLVELVPDAIWIERDGRIAFVNRACLQLLGADSIAQLLGRSPLDFIHPDFHSLAISRRERLLADPQRNGYVEKKIVPLRGEPKDVEIAETSFRDEGGTALLAVMRDISARKASDRELRQSREHLRQLSAALQAAREEEQTRIARELHDELGQALTALKMDVAAIVGELKPDQAAAIGRTTEMARLLENTVAAVRRIATQLRPLMLDDLGLLPTIGWLVNDFSKRTGIAVALSLPDPETDIDPQLSTVLFRVLQESLTNVARHAGATHVKIALTCSGTDMRLSVSDNGRGFDGSEVRSAKTFGLLGMRERAGMAGGTLTLDSQPGSGTSIEMVVPLPR
jgi:two-component system, NarL family, sensor histidine kinase UhpB